MHKGNPNERVARMPMVISIIIAIASMLFLIFVLFTLIIPSIIPSRPGIRMARELFLENKELIVVVRDYFINSGYNSIHVDRTRDTGTMFVSGQRNSIIRNIEVVEAIEILQKNGYQSMGKDENAVWFISWSNMDNGRGVVYSIDGHAPNKSVFPFLTHIEPLSTYRWYYFEEDFNEWRLNR